jgi:hypothetical protein
MHVQMVLYLFSHQNEGIAPPIVIKHMIFQLEQGYYILFSIHNFTSPNKMYTIFYKYIFIIYILL